MIVRDVRGVLTDGVVDDGDSGPGLGRHGERLKDGWDVEDGG